MPSANSGPPATGNLLRDALPPRQDSDQEEEDQNWDGESNGHNRVGKTRTWSGRLEQGQEDQNWEGESKDQNWVRKAGRTRSGRLELSKEDQNWVRKTGSGSGRSELRW